MNQGKKWVHLTCNKSSEDREHPVYPLPNEADAVKYFMIARMCRLTPYWKLAREVNNEEVNFRNMTLAEAHQTRRKIVPLMKSIQRDCKSIRSKILNDSESSLILNAIENTAQKSYHKATEVLGLLHYLKNSFKGSAAWIEDAEEIVTQAIDNYHNQTLATSTTDVTEESIASNPEAPALSPPPSSITPKSHPRSIVHRLRDAVAEARITNGDDLAVTTFRVHHHEGLSDTIKTPSETRIASTPSHQ